SRVSTIDIIANAEASLVYPAESRSRKWRPMWARRLARTHPRLAEVLFGLLPLLAIPLAIIVIWLWFAYRPATVSAVYLGSTFALLGAFKIIVMLRPHHVLRHLAATRRARLAPTRNVMKPVLIREMAAERIAARHAYRATMDRSHCVHGWRWLHADARGAVLMSGVLYVVTGAITLWTGTTSLLVLAFVAGGLATTMYNFLRTRLFPNLSKFTDVQRSTNHCPHCDYDLSSVEHDQSVLREGIHAGPPRCPECGSHYPLLPPPTPEEVMCWDRRIRRSFEPPAWWRMRETR
ncbi:MAG TPA: hypothetical protein VK157_10580, partial [Phycisphaerales bacterium]|nr:hypothetical protein [Phycisphaerales bacterium]